jgi:hypothetical protein
MIVHNRPEEMRPDMLRFAIENPFRIDLHRRHPCWTEK